MNIAQRVCSTFMGLYKLHVAWLVDVLYTRMCSDCFNGSEHSMTTEVWGVTHVNEGPPLGMVHSSGGIMGARAAHLNGLGCHINYLELEEK